MPQTSLGELSALLQTPSLDFMDPTGSKGRGGKGSKGRGGVREGRGGKDTGKKERGGREGKRREAPHPQF